MIQACDLSLHCPYIPIYNTKGELKCPASCVRNGINTTLSLSLSPWKPITRKGGADCYSSNIYSDSSSSDVAASTSSAGGMSLKSRPSAGKSGVSGPSIPSELRLNPLCKKVKMNQISAFGMRWNGWYFDFLQQSNLPTLLWKLRTLLWRSNSTGSHACC